MEKGLAFTNACDRIQMDISAQRFPLRREGLSPILGPQPRAPEPGRGAQITTGSEISEDSVCQGEIGV